MRGQLVLLLRKCRRSWFLHLILDGYQQFVSLPRRHPSQSEAEETRHGIRGTVQGEDGGYRVCLGAGILKSKVP